MIDRYLQYWPKGKPLPAGARIVNAAFSFHSDLIEYDERPMTVPPYARPNYESQTVELVVCGAVTIDLDPLQARRLAHKINEVALEIEGRPSRPLNRG